jgi:hypothetical protein
VFKIPGLPSGKHIIQEILAGFCDWLIVFSYPLSNAQGGKAMLKSEVIMPSATHSQKEAYQLQLIHLASAWRKAHMLGQMLLKAWGSLSLSLFGWQLPCMALPRPQ